MLCIVLSACLSNALVIGQLKSDIKQVGVDSNVDMPDVLHYKNLSANKVDAKRVSNNSNDLKSLATGVAVQAVSKAFELLINGTPQSMIKDYLEENNIQVDMLLHDQFLKQLQFDKDSSEWQFVNNNADAVFRLSIKKYGLQQTNAHSLYLKPVLEIEIQLVDNENKVLWRDKEIISHRYEHTPEHRLDEYMKNPEYLQDAFSESAFYAVSNVMKRIN